MKNLYKVRKLLDQLGPSEKSSSVEFLLRGNINEEPEESGVFNKEEELNDMEVEEEKDEEPPEKKLKTKVETGVNVKDKIDISILLEECSDLDIDQLDMTEDQERSVLLKWLAKFSIQSNTLELPEVILSRNSMLYEDSQVVGALATSFVGLGGPADGSDKCVKFAKFLLQVLSKVVSLEETVARKFKLVAERNRTFLKKRLEMEVEKKAAS